MIDINRLENVRIRGTKVLARCPACAAVGRDRSGNHLFINTESGQFGCVAFSGDSDHRRQIFNLVGEPDYEPEAVLRPRLTNMAATATAKLKALEQERFKNMVRSRRDAITASHAWSQSQVMAESPGRNLVLANDPRHFLSALFEPDEIVWAGEVHHSGQDGRHHAHWRTIADWQHPPASEVGPMTCPATWRRGTHSRIATNVVGTRYVVLDFDGFDGQAPTSPDEIQRHIRTSLAIVRWLRDGLDWRLAAILHTGGKSIHAWFHTPPKEALESLRSVAHPLGIDDSLIGRPEHPCRLPGHAHPRTGGISQTLWIKNQRVIC